MIAEPSLSEINTPEEVDVMGRCFPHGNYCPCQEYDYPFNDTVSVHAQLYAYYEGWT